MAKQLPQKNNGNTTRQLIAASRFEGPLPPPDLFAKYEQVCPGAADRILRMAEDQSKHRQELEKKIVKSNSRDSLAGIICGLLIGITTIISGAFVAAHGQPWPGALLGGT